MGNYVCLFKVYFYDEVNGENKEERGFCSVDSMTQAVSYLEEKLYGSNLLEIRYMELFDTCPIISLETMVAMKKDLEEL